ncbi:MAG: DegT/DnrJ/EryC1/StrS family aminotransferase [Candidatus Omnitrophota bacterium]
MDAIVAHTKPSLDDREIAAVMGVLKSRLVNEGSLASQLVRSLVDIVGGYDGVPVSAGTLGLHLALKSLGVDDEKDEVIVPDFACRCLYDCVKTAGGTPIFCDINLDDISLNIDDVRLRAHENTKAIVLPHMFGCPADLQDFLSLNIPLIEDCAHSAGAAYRGQKIGSFGDYSCFSFEGSKLLAAGEGGVVLSNNPQRFERLNNLRYGLNDSPQYHYRLSDVVASIALAQLEKLPAMIAKRNSIAMTYMEELRGLEIDGKITLPHSFGDRDRTFYRFVVLCGEESSPLIEFSARKGVLIRKPLPSGCLSDHFGHNIKENKNSRLLSGNGASLPIYPDLNDEEIRRVIEAIYSYYKRE